MFYATCTRQCGDLSMSVGASPRHRQASLLSRRCAKLTVVASLLLWFAACAKPVEQEVTGRLASPSGAAVSAQLRLYESRLCSGNYTETSTNKEGRFSFRANTVKSATSKAKQELALCRKHDVFWQALWTSAHPGGATRIELACTVQNKGGKGECEPRFDYGP